MPWRIVCRLANHGPLESSQNTDEVLFLEGIELLSPWRQWRLLRSLRHQRLLITSHRALHGLPVIAQLTPDLDLAQTLVATLLSGRHGSELATDTVRECFEEHQGNLREMMLALYDVYEELPVCSAAESSGG